MNRKWNLFSKRSRSKVDSHGTTTANEEIEFQPGTLFGQEFQWVGKNASSSNKGRDAFPTGKTPDFRRVLSMPAGSSQDSAHILYQNKQPENATIFEIHPTHSFKGDHTESLHQSHTSMPHHFDIEKNAFDSHPLVQVANITRPSPKFAKKLIKPRALSSSQTTFVTSTENNKQGVTVLEEYTDPFDAVAPVPVVRKEKLKALSSADGYVEPYKAQQIYNDVTHTGSAPGKTNASYKQALYGGPWDHKEEDTKQFLEKSIDYEEPWDRSKQMSQLLLMNKQRIDKHGELVSEYPMVGHLLESGDSSTSSSSGSQARQRMMKLEYTRNSPYDSPQDSPNLDKRLIRPRDGGQSEGNFDINLQVFNGSGRAKFKPADHRLLKFDPADTRAASSKSNSLTNSPVSSNRVSPNRSPLNTLICGDTQDRFMNETSKRSSSPLVQPVNVSHYLLCKAKSRSLDTNHRQYFPNVRGKSGSLISKSASANQLGQGEAISNVGYRGNHPLSGVTEYEEPWDAPNKLQRVPHVAHVRSRSDELDLYEPPSLQVKHAKSYSFDHLDADHDDLAESEHSWRQNEVVPQTHLESMQRFQHHVLELHPAEAITLRDFDPLLPLRKQCWFHGEITRDQANRRLQREVEGTYLVRNSESVRNNYSLSLRTTDETIHMVISRTRDGFWILGEFSAPFHSVPEMVAFYTKHRLKISDVKQICLKYPLPDDVL